MILIGHEKDNHTEDIVVKTSKTKSSPILVFELGDLEGIASPHNDTLVIRVTVANFDVVRVFVDIGSSVKVLFRIA